MTRSLLMYENADDLWAQPGALRDGRDIPFQIRDLHCDDLDTTLSQTVPHIRNSLFGPGEDTSRMCFKRLSFWNMDLTRVITGLVCCGQNRSRSIH